MAFRGVRQLLRRGVWQGGHDQPPMFGLSVNVARVASLHDRWG
jgi:hypothetical protein